MLWMPTSIYVKSKIGNNDIGSLSCIGQMTTGSKLICLEPLQWNIFFFVKAAWVIFFLCCSQFLQRLNTCDVIAMQGFSLGDDTRTSSSSSSNSDRRWQQWSSSTATAFVTAKYSNGKVKALALELLVFQFRNLTLTSDESYQFFS